MRRAKKLLIIAILSSPIVGIVRKVTIFNPAWVIGMKYPDAERQLHTVNSPDLHFWPAVSALFGVPMTGPDHSLTLTIGDHPTPLRLDDFIGADELYVKNSKVEDISGYWSPLARLSGAVFLNCDFTLLLPEQRSLLKPFLDQFPNSYCVPYETKKMQNKL